jgi:hypothetical protein
MDHEPTDPLSDPALEREIESLLAVDPSPEFVARVRTRIAGEPMGRRWRVFPRAWSFEPLFAVGMLGVVLSIVIPSWLRPEPPARVEQPAAATSPAQPQRVVTEPVRPEPDVPSIVGRVRLPAFAEGSGEARQSALRARRRPDALPASDISPFAEVLVSADEVRAYEFVVGIIRRQRLPAAPVEESVDGALPPVTIEPLTIEPLPQIARLETGERP